MPNYKPHLALGITFLTIFALLTNIQFKELIIFLAIAIIYSLLPDIDIGNSKAGRSIRIILSLSSLTLIIYGLLKNKIIGFLGIGLLILLTLLQFVKHRKFIHTIRAAILLSLPLLSLGIPEAVFGLICYILHLAFDKHLRF